MRKFFKSCGFNITCSKLKGFFQKDSVFFFFFLVALKYCFLEGVSFVIEKDEFVGGGGG